jgi:hypothetical protein
MPVCWGCRENGEISRLVSHSRNRSTTPLIAQRRGLRLSEPVV